METLKFDELKNRLRAAYISYRRRKMAAYRGGEDLEKALDGAAQNCAELRVLPEDYMAALYEVYAVRYDKFYPNILQGSKAKQTVRNYLDKFETISPLTLWNTQWRSLKLAIDNTKRKVEDILFDQAMPFTPWFRIIALTSADARIVERYGAQAKASLNKDLEAFLKEKVPAQFDRIKKL